MSDDDASANGNGSEAPQAAEEGIPLMPQEMQRMLLESTTAQVMEILGYLADHVDENAAMLIGEHVAKEQLGPIAQNILPTIFSAEGRQEYPTYFVSIKRAEDDTAAVAKAPKSLREVHDPGHALQNVMILALMMSPGCRALLKAYGFECVFGQSKEAGVGKIILSS